MGYYTIWLVLVKSFFVPFWEIGKWSRLSGELGGLEDRVIGLVSGVLKGGENILALKKRVILKNFVERGSRTEQLQNVGDTNAHAANTGAAPAFAGVNGDSLKTFAFHRGYWG
jgi:hypothetical protein